MRKLTLISLIVMTLPTLAADTPCSLSTLAGAYGLQRNGKTTAGGMVSGVGVVTFDGAGNYAGHQSLSRNGAFSKEAISGTYTVSADCSAKLTSSNGDISTAMITHSAEEVVGMSLTAGSNEAVHFERINDEGAVVAPVCKASMFKGTYGYLRNGHVPVGDLLAIGILYSDGQGNHSTTQNIDRGGAFTTAAFDATYTVDPDCMGTNYDTSGNVFSEFVIVHDGAEVLGISETPGNNVVIHFERIADPPEPKDHPRNCRDDMPLEHD